MTVEPHPAHTVSAQGLQFLQRFVHRKAYAVNQENPNQRETKTFNTYKIAGDANVPSRECTRPICSI